MPKVVTTSSNASADDNPTTKNISNVQLLYRVGEALQASKRSLEGNQSKGQKNSKIGYTDSKVNGGIASLVQLVQSIGQDESMQDIQGTMDWLARKIVEGNSLDINLTNQVEDGTKSIDSRARCNRESDDSYSKEGIENAKNKFL